jgi:hypothetical protein
LFAIISRVIFCLPVIVPTTVDALFPVFVSILFVWIEALFAKVAHELSVEVNVPVSVNVPQLPAGNASIDLTVKSTTSSVFIAAAVIYVGSSKETSPLIESIIFTYVAVLPPLFP